MYLPATEMNIVDLYTVGLEELEVLEINPILEVPFVHSITLNEPNGGNVCVWGVFNSGTMVNAMCFLVYSKVTMQSEFYYTNGNLYNLPCNKVITYLPILLWTFYTL